MAGDLALKTGSAVTITTTGGSTATSVATSAGDIDLRTGGTTFLIEQLEAFFELTCQWATTTSIAAGTIVADLYLVPKLDGTNAAEVDTGYIPGAFRFGSFVSPKALSATTNYRFATAVGDLFPALYSAYILNRSGQTISANWTLKVLSARGQYT